MLLVRTRVIPSQIEGLGVFADEPIKAGTAIWKLDGFFDRMMPVSEVAALPPHMQDFIDTYGYPHKELAGLIVFETDNGRFMNHSLSPNTDFSNPSRGFAICDIAVGEEITCNYFEFDLSFRGFDGVAAALPDAAAADITLRM